MSALSTYLADALLNFLLRGTAFPAPATLYAGLSSTATTDAGGYTEPSGNNYGRVAIPCTTGQWAAPFTESGFRKTSNVNPITWPTATGGNWGTMTHVFLADAASAGNVLFHSAIGSSVIINNGSAYSMGAAQLKPGFNNAQAPTTYLLDLLLGHLLRGAAMTMPASLWAGLSSTTTTVAGAYTEPAGGNYSRPEIPCASGNWSAPATVSSARQVGNVNAVAFPVASADWPATAHGFLADALSGGNVYFQGALSGSVTVLNTQSFAFDPTQLTASLT